MKSERRRNYDKLGRTRRKTTKRNAYLVPVGLGGVAENTGLGFAYKVTEGIHFQRAVEI